MGWCSGTDIFDNIASVLLDQDRAIPEDLAEEILDELFTTLEHLDWDCQHDSNYWDHPIVQRIARRHWPADWFEDEED